MKNQIEKLIENNDIKVLGQVFNARCNKSLMQHVENNIPDFEYKNVREKLYVYLNDITKDDITCEKGKTKLFRTLDSGYGYCGNLKHCQCMQEHVKTFERDTVQQTINQKKTWLAKYGVDNPSKNPNIVHQQKISRAANTNKKDMKKICQDSGYDKVVSRVAIDLTPNFTKEEYNGCFRKNVYSWTCNHCKSVVEGHVDYGNVPRCTKCHPHNISVGEKELVDFVKSCGIVIIERDRIQIYPLELDIYIPSLNLAIEYNGVYWHSSARCDQYSHVDKYLKCKEKGIHLIQIFEDEWENKKDLIKNMLLAKLGKAMKTHARRCVIKEVKKSEAKLFLQTHHLQGHFNSSINLGLYHNNELKAMMTFGKLRYDKKQEGSFEMLRYCSDGVVVGGASKLLEHFKKMYDPREIVSYANRCWSNGNLYTKLGFTDVTINQRNTGYWYIDHLTRHHRSSFTKKRLVKLGYDENLTESEIMDNLNFHKVFDAGNYKFLWKKI